jgi:hypothetical protein
MKDLSECLGNLGPARLKLNLEKCIFLAVSAVYTWTHFPFCPKINNIKRASQNMGKLSCCFEYRD